MFRSLNERGLSIITVAVSLPIILLVGLAVLELFLYFRACAVVQRAAAEAGRAMVAALPGDASGYGAGTYPNTFSSVEDKALLSTDADSDIYYERSDGNDTDAINLPFLLSTSELGRNAQTQNPGVQYLPLVSVWTCLEPQNETPHTRAGCTAGQQGFLTYQQPAFLDFDGDRAEDIAFYYGNTGHDWHIITSSSGALFRHSLRFELGSETTAGDVWLPAAGDYDGDGKTDPAVMRANEANRITLQIRLSSKFYEQVESTLANGTGLSNSQLRIPVVGRYNTDGSGPLDRDRFAVVLLETTTGSTQPSDTYYLKTLVWPPLDTETNPPIADTPTGYNGWDKKPAPGSAWRPAFGDYDGDRYTDIGWLTWKGGNPTAHVAGDALGTSIDGAVATDSPMTPWALYYPRDSVNAPGLYVIERNSHRVLLVTKGANNFIGDQDGENVEVIVGNVGVNPDLTFLSPDPLGKGEFSDESCSGCYGGGGDTVGANAASRQVRQPTSVASLGAVGSPLFVADFGNRKVKMITADDGKVDGTPGEAISTIAGGGAPGGTCPAIEADGTRPAYCAQADAACSNAGVSPAGTPCPWGCYVTADPINPLCISVRPTALEILRDSNPEVAGNQEVLFVADERTSIFLIYQGADNAWGGGDDQMQRLAGNYFSLAANGTPTGSALTTPLGIPTALSLQLDRDGYPVGLRVVTRSNPSTLAAGRFGGVFQVNANQTGAGPPIRRGFPINTRTETITPLAGTWGADPEARPAFHAPGTGAGSITFRNPAAIVAASFENTPSAGIGDPVLGMFLTSWLNNSQAGVPYENYLGHGYLWGAYSGGAGTIPTLRWLNNPHLLSWGKRPPGDEAPGTFQFSWANRAPLSTLPVEPAAGVALSPDNRYLYHSQTRRGEIFVTYLDEDGDGYANFGGRFNHDCAACTTAYEWNPGAGSQMNNDGDDLHNNNDTSAQGRDPYHFEPGMNSLRPMEVYQAARLWAIGTNTTTNPPGGISLPNGSLVSRLEIVMDRFSAVQGANSGSQTIPPVEAAPYHVLNRNTVAAPNARGAMHQTPVWPGGVTRDTQVGIAGAPYFRLSPIVLGHTTPTDYEIKDESGFTDCDNWQLNETLSDFTLAIDDSGYLAQPATSCNRDIALAPYNAAPGIKVASRRVHPARWSGQGIPDVGTCTSSPCGHQVGFLDRDGLAGRNPVVYATGRVTPGDVSPLMVHIGLLESCADYPGQYAQASLFTRTSLIPTKFSLTLGPNDWVMNCSETAPFFTAGNTNVLSIMADYHAEKSNLTQTDLRDTVEVHGNRTSQTGPVALTAYRILRDSLRIAQTNSIAARNHAQVSFTTNNESGYTTSIATVRYVFPLFGPIAALYGSDSVVITRSNQRVTHQLGQNL